MNNNNNNNNNSNNTNNAAPEYQVSPDVLERIREQTRSFSRQWHEYIQTHLSPPNQNFPRGVGHDDNHNNHNNQHNESLDTASVLSEHKWEQSELEQDRDNKEKENLQLKIKIERLESKIKALTIENSKLKICVDGLVKICQEGPKPQYESVKMAKTENAHWTQQLAKRKKSLKIYFDKVYKNRLILDVQPTQFEKNKNHSENKWISDDALKCRIRNHLQINGINNMKTRGNPQILIKNQMNQRRATKDNKLVGSFKMDQCKKKKLTQCIKTYRIPTPNRVKALEGNVGIKAMMDIPKGTIIGQYTGTEYLESEFERIFEHSNDYNLRNQYAFDTKIYIPSDINDVINDDIDCDYDEKMDDKIDGNPSYYQTATTEVIVIDGWADRKNNLMIYINDCRKNINDEEPSNDDEFYWNVSFRTVMINGYPAVFVVTRKDIKAGEPLMIFYTENYGKSVETMNNYEKVMKRMKGLIDGTILKIVGMDTNTDNDTYILDM